MPHPREVSYRNYASRTCCRWTQPITNADVVYKVLCVYQGNVPSQGSGNNLFFLKNAGIQTNSIITETSQERMLREQLATE
jgi:hypothetical protein